MEEHLQRSMPAHLKKYQNGGAYVPEHAENEIAQHMQDSLPSHMKEYAGAYTQQNIVQPGLEKAGATRAPVSAAAVSPSQPAVVYSPNQQSAPASASPANPGVSGPQADYGTAVAPNHPYSFITNPEQPSKPPLLSRLPGGNSLIARVGLIAGGLLVLLIIFIVLRGLLSSGPDLTGFPAVVQDQQELIHLATNAAQEPSLSSSNQNFVATMQGSLTSSQSKTITYMAKNHKKVGTKQLNLKVSTATDSQLTTAAAATTYNQTFHEIIQTKLTTYGKDLQQAYKLDKGKKGRVLLSDSYNQAQLLQIQLDQITN